MDTSEHCFSSRSPCPPQYDHGSSRPPMRGARQTEGGAWPRHEARALRAQPPQPRKRARSAMGDAATVGAERPGARWRWRNYRRQARSVRRRRGGGGGRKGSCGRRRGCWIGRCTRARRRDSGRWARGRGGGGRGRRCPRRGRSRSQRSRPNREVDQGWTMDMA